MTDPAEVIFYLTENFFHDCFHWKELTILSARDIAELTRESMEMPADTM